MIQLQVYSDIKNDLMDHWWCRTLWRCCFQSWNET